MDGFRNQMIWLTSAFMVGTGFLFYIGYSLKDFGFFGLLTLLLCFVSMYIYTGYMAHRYEEQRRVAEQERRESERLDRKQESEERRADKELDGRLNKEEAELQIKKEKEQLQNSIAESKARDDLLVQGRLAVLHMKSES